MDEGFDLLRCYLLMCFLFGIAIGFVIWGIGPDSDTIDLAQSICDQEYNMNYDSYDNGVLKCKPKDIKAEVQYDGIIMEIGK